MKNWRAFIAGLCGWVAAAFLAAMMLLTVADVVLRAVFNRPIRGTFELIELLLACTFFLALPAVFLRDENLVVDIVDGVAPRRVPLLKRIAEILAVVVLAVMALARLDVRQGRGHLRRRDLGSRVTAILYWIPVLTGIVGSAVVALVMALRGNGKS